MKNTSHIKSSHWEFLWGRNFLYVFSVRPVRIRGYHHCRYDIFSTKLEVLAIWMLLIVFLQSLLCYLRVIYLPQVKTLEMSLWKVILNQPASWLSLKPWTRLSYFSYELETVAVQMFQRGTKPDLINPTWPELVLCKSHAEYFGGKSVQRCPAVLCGSGSSTNPATPELALSLLISFCSGLRGVSDGMQTMQAHTARTGHVLNGSF